MVVTLTAVATSPASSDRGSPGLSKITLSRPRPVLKSQLLISLPEAIEIETDSHSEMAGHVDRGFARFHVTASDTLTVAGDDALRAVTNDRALRDQSLRGRPLERLVQSKDLAIFGFAAIRSTRRSNDVFQRELVYSAYVIPKTSTIKRVDFLVTPPGDRTYEWGELARKILASVATGPRAASHATRTEKICFGVDCNELTVTHGWLFVDTRSARQVAYEIRAVRHLDKISVRTPYCIISLGAGALPTTYSPDIGELVPVNVMDANASWRISEQHGAHIAHATINRYGTPVGVFCENTDRLGLQAAIAMIESLRPAK